MWEQHETSGRIFLGAASTPPPVSPSLSPLSVTGPLSPPPLSLSPDWAALWGGGGGRGGGGGGGGGGGDDQRKQSRVSVGSSSLSLWDYFQLLWFHLDVGAVSLSSAPLQLILRGPEDASESCRRADVEGGGVNERRRPSAPGNKAMQQLLDSSVHGCSIIIIVAAAPADMCLHRRACEGDGYITQHAFWFVRVYVLQPSVVAVWDSDESFFSRIRESLLTYSECFNNSLEFSSSEARTSTWSLWFKDCSVNTNVLQVLSGFMILVSARCQSVAGSEAVLNDWSHSSQQQSVRMWFSKLWSL